MLVIKIGGSVFAPKDKNIFDSDYLELLRNILANDFQGRVVLLHGTGSFGHNFVIKYGISEKTFNKFLEYRKKFFLKIDSIFKDFSRIPGEYILEKNFDINVLQGKIISGGDAFKETYEILSSDDLFSKMMLFNKSKMNIILTDVDGVYDNNNNIIKKLSLKNIDSIHFRKKEGDVTNSMKGKLLALKKGLIDKNSGVWICNGFDLNNFSKILKTGSGIGTYITL